MAMTTTQRQEGEPTSEINTTPLIDVMLVLLIMLIVTLPPQRHAVKIDTPVPCGKCDPPAPPPAPVRITIDFDGALAWNDEPVDAATLDRRLAAEAHHAMQPEIHIQPHQRAEYRHVVHVMAAAQREGLTKLGVMGAM